MVQVHVWETRWRFKSSLRHHIQRPGSSLNLAFFVHAVFGARAGQKNGLPRGERRPVKRYLCAEETVVSIACLSRPVGYIDTLNDGQITQKLRFSSFSFPTPEFPRNGARPHPDNHRRA